ncbi:MAG: PQQ-binding-like beta-propeller repeat protein [Gemmatimonadaceae bacterium]|nr:PQQ-binding-like beta-propeller repeat protein [Gemmatimonadaceae bacterium]
MHCGLWRAALLAIALAGAEGCSREGVLPPGDGGPAPARNPGDYLWSVPLVGQGLASFDDSSAFFLGRNHEVLAVDKRSGRERWRRTIGAPGGATLGFGTVVAGPNVVVTDVDLWAFDRRTGAPAWRVGLPGVVLAQSNPTAHGDTVFGGSSNGQFVAIDARTGATIWRVQPISGDTNVAYDPVYARGRVFGCLSSDWTSVLVALASATGTVLWERPLRVRRPLRTSRCLGNVAVGGGLVIVTAMDDGYVLAVDELTGTERWRAPHVVRDDLGDTRFAAVVGSIVVLGSSFGTIVGLDLATGAERWRMNTQRGSATDPLVADDSLVFITHAGGHLAAVRASTGEVAWRACGGFGTPGQCTYTAAVDTDRLYHTGFEVAYAIKK